MKRIKYTIEIFCDVDGTAVIPTGSSAGIIDHKGDKLNMVKYPAPETIMSIWIGKYLSYPHIKELVD